VENESPLAPSAHSSSWSGAPDDEVEYAVPELLQQLRRQAHRHYLDDAMLAPARYRRTRGLPRHPCFLFVKQLGHQIKTTTSSAYLLRDALR
jgi:hypothetical protein